jgi:hypothetical protein
MCEFLISLGVKHCDNQSAVKVLLGEKYIDQIKHETVKIKYLWDLICDGIMVVEWTTTNCLAADGLTKVLS